MAVHTKSKRKARRSGSMTAAQRGGNRALKAKQVLKAKKKRK